MNMKQFRPLVWFVIAFFTFSTTPHIELIISELADLVASPLYAAEVQSADTDPASEADAQVPEDQAAADKGASTEAQTATAAAEEGSESEAAGMTKALPEVVQFSGAATFKYPIVVPSGRLSMAPQIALTYNSQMKNGWIGVGVSLDMGSIQRNAKWGLSYANDSGLTDINGNPLPHSAPFVTSVNGSSVELVRHTAWDTVVSGYDGYRAKIEGSLQQYLYSSSNGWIVISKDGTKYYYGSDDANHHSVRWFERGNPVLRETLSWHLDKAEDTNHNWMKVYYTKDSGEIYLDRIEYTGNSATSLSATHFVKFVVSEGRTDIPVTYNTNYEVKTRKRLNVIEVREGSLTGPLVRKYILAYNDSPTTKRSRLISITPYGKDGTTKLPVQTLTWQGDNSGTYTRPSDVPMSPGGGWDAAHVRVGDVNGDGHADLVSWYGSQFAVYLSTGSGTYTRVDSNINTGGGWGGGGYVWTADFNGDGLMDVVSATGGLFATYLSNGDGTFRRVTPDCSMDTTGGWSPSNVRAGDVNGDGLADLVSWSGSRIAVLLSTLNPETGDVTFTRIRQTDQTDYPLDTTGGWNADWVMAADFNGDGLMDLVSRSGSHFATLLSKGDGTFNRTTPDADLDTSGGWDSSHVRIGDLNGDGRADLVSWSGSKITTYFSKGDGTYVRPADFIIDTGGGWGGGYYVWAGDFNGDGLLDLISRSGSLMATYFSRGDGTYVRPSDAPLNTGGGWSPDHVRTGDFNGDGRTDLVSWTGSLFATIIPAGPIPDLVQTVQNGIGGSFTIGYTPSSDYDNTVLPFVIPVVKTVTAADGRGQSVTTQYSYADGFHDIAERDFRGFGHVTGYQMRPDQTWESKTETWFNQGVVLKGTTSRQLSTSYDSHSREVNNTWVSAYLGSTGLGCEPGYDSQDQWVFCLPRLDQTDTIVRDNGANPYTTTVQYEYDLTYLNLVAEHRYGDDSEVPRPEVHTYTAYTSNVPELRDKWIISKPIDMIVADGLGNIASRKWMDYFSETGSLKYEEVCKSDTPSTGCVSRPYPTDPTNQANPNPVVRYEYTSEGNVQTITDPLGHSTTFAYETDTKTYVAAKSNTLGHVTTTTYDYGLSKALTITPPHLQGVSGNPHITYQYDTLGRLIREDRPDGGYAIYTYNVPDPANPNSQYVQKEEHTLASGSHLTHTTISYFDGSGRTYRTKATGPDAAMIVVDTHFDSLGRLSQKSNPYFEVGTVYWTTVTYDGLSRAINTQTPDGHHVSTTYQGLFKTVYDQNDNAKTYSYDTFQRLTRITDFVRLQPIPQYTCPLTQITYNNPTQCSSACNQTAYCTQPVAASGTADAGTTEAIARVTTSGSTLTFSKYTCTSWSQDPYTGEYYCSGYGFVAVGTVTLTGATASGTVTSSQGYAVKSVATSGNTLTFRRSNGSSLGTITLTGATATGSADAGTGYSIQKIVASGNTLTFYRYSGSTPVSVGAITLTGLYSCPLSGGSSCSGSPPQCSAPVSCEAWQEQPYDTEAITDYSYDTLGNLKTVKKPRPDDPDHYPQVAITTSMEYDSLGKKIEMIDPDMSTWHYVYDKAGNLVSQTDAKNQTITFQYDELNRLNLKTHVGTNPLYAVSYSYDDPNLSYSKGMLTKVSNGLTGENLAEDSVTGLDFMQRVTSSQKKVGSVIKTISRAYDTAGRAVSITYPNAVVINYEYQAAGNLIRVTQQGRQTPLIQYSLFNALLQATFADYANGVRTEYHYDEATHRISTLRTEKGATIHQNLAYTFDPKGNLTALQDNANSITHTYRYDDLDRLISARGDGPVSYPEQTYTYDPIGNILSKSDVGSYTYNYAEKPHAVRSTAGLLNITLDYDENGNMVSRLGGGSNITVPSTDWNYDNKPLKITKNGSDVNFLYDGNGQRAKKEGFGKTTVYFGELYEERNGTGVTHIFAGNQRIATFRGSIEQYVHPNHLSSASVITDSYGNTKQKLEYYPFGTYRYANAPDQQKGTYDFDGSFPNANFTFTDQEDDDDFGLYNYDARLYDPVLGRFISADSVVPDPGNSQAFNRYSYVVNSPLLYTDPSGHLFGIDDLTIAVLLYTMAKGAAVGAAIGAGVAAATGQDVGQGALTGAVSGAIFAGVGAYVHAAKSITLVTQAALHTGAGVASGGINAAITGGDVGMGMLTGGASAGVGLVLGSQIPTTGNEVADFGIQLSGRAAIGGITGGMAATMYGNDFGEGFKQGAMSAGYGYLFNCALPLAIVAVDALIKATAYVFSALAVATVATHYMNEGGDRETTGEEGKTGDFEKGDSIGIDRFTERGKGGVLRDPKTGQHLEPDRGRSSGGGSHGGSWWKLYDRKGDRIGTVSKDGKWLRR